MKREDYTISITSRFEALKGTLFETLPQLFKQEFAVTQNIIGSENPKDDLQNEIFPMEAIIFKVTSPRLITQVWMLPPAMVSRLYSWMVGTEATEQSIGEAELDGIKEGSNQIIGQMLALMDSEGETTKVDNLEIALLESVDTLPLTEYDAAGATVSYTVEVNEQSFVVNQYLFTDMSDTEDDSLKTTLSDDEIDRMLNGDEVNSGVSLDEELGEDVDVQQVEFGSFADSGAGSASGQARNIDMLLDVDLEVLVELGRKSMLIKDVLKLGKGSVVELDKAAGEPLEVFVNGRKLAEGEVVVVDDHFGIRITKLVGTAERIKSLG